MVKKDRQEKETDFPAFGNRVVIDLSRPLGVSEGEVDDKEWYMKRRLGIDSEDDSLADFRSKALFIAENAGSYSYSGDIKSIHYRNNVQNSDAIYHRGIFEFGALRIKTIKDTTLSGTMIHPPYVQISLKQEKRLPIIRIKYHKFEEIYLYDHTNKIHCGKEFSDKRIMAEVKTQIDNIYRAVSDLMKHKTPDEIRNMPKESLEKIVNTYRTAPTKK